MLRDDPLASVLTIDLTGKSFAVTRREDLFEGAMGGAGVAARLLAEHCPPGADPLSPENPVVMAVGPLTGLFPLASKTVATFKSPLTGNYGESHCGGRSAVSIRLAGYGAIVITGASDLPVYLSIADGTVRFRDASSLWGMGNSFTVGRIIRENEGGSGLRSIMRIGKGGERLVRYASVTSESYRHFGRLGLGAVFGAKRLKAVVVAGRRSLPVADRKEYARLYGEIHAAAVSSPAMRKYHDLGTAENVAPLAKLGGLPTRNLRSGTFEGAEALSGEAFARHYLGRRLACAHCPVGCIHIAALREPYGDEPYFYKTTMIGYDYEPIYSLGTMLGMTDPEGFLRLMDRVERVGIDAMSAGVVLAWATEAMERGIVTEADTGGLRLAWGDDAAYREAVERIVGGKGEFWEACGLGVAEAARRFGGEEFALAFGGNEMPGYHTGPATHAGVLAGARHSHLDNAGYSIDQKLAGKPLPPPAEMAATIVKEESWRQVMSSLVICFFARGVYTPEVASRALACAGMPLSPDDLQRIGGEIFRDKYRLKLREGFDFGKLSIPKRVLETATPLGPVDEGYVRSVLDAIRTAVGG